MAVKFSPWGNQQFVTSAGVPASGYKLFSYAAGSSTKQSTYTDSTGVTPQTNPIILDANGYPTNGQIWLTVGQTYKFVLTASTDSDPPTSPIKTIDVIAGVNDASVSTSQWQSSGLTPTYVSTTSFTLAGDQTTDFHVNRRLQFTVTAGTVYGTITGSVFGALTTVTVAMDTGQTLDSGLSAVNLSALRSDHTAIPSPFTTMQRGFLSGLTMSTAGSSATMSISAGMSVDSTNLYLMSLAASISKTTSSWVVGSAVGGLDTGAIAINTWYHFYLIKRLDTSVVDVVFSTNATTPTLPANYTIYRRIGSMKTNGSSQWTTFNQVGDYFRLAVTVQDVSATNPASSAVSRTLSSPTGIKVMAFGSVFLSAADTALLTDLAAIDVAANGAAVTLLTGASGGACPFQCMTNTSAQIRSRLASGAAVTLVINTDGWFDTRGKID